MSAAGDWAHARPGPVERASAGVNVRHPWAGAWLLPALLGLAIAVLGTGAAIAISDDGEEPSAVSTATGGSLTVTDSGSTLTAPEPTVPTATTTVQTTQPPTTTAPAPPANPAAVSWPRNQRGWTIVLLSLPQANGRSAAAAKATEARRGGLRRVGVLELVPLCEPAPRLLRRLHGRFRHRGGGGKRAAARPGGLPRRLPARNCSVTRQV